jgi:hypothetical protein
LLLRRAFFGKKLFLCPQICQRNVSLGKPDGFPLLIKGAVLFQRVRSGTCGFYRSAAP